MPKTTPKSSDFVHLHNHTHFSLLDGLTKLKPLVGATKELGMEAVAITDHGYMSGAVEFYKECKEQDIKPLIGMEAYVASRKHTDKEAGKDKQIYHLILIAMNNTGYRNLMKLSSIAHLDGFYYKARVDHDLLRQYSEGLICLSGCIGGEVGDALRGGRREEAIAAAKNYQSIFGDRYYLELQDHGHEWDEQKAVNEQLLSLSDELNIPAVVTSDAHYLTHDDQTAHEILLCVQTGSFLADEKRMSLKDTELHVTDPLEIIERWKDRPEVITNTKAIADRCDVSIELGGILIPKFEVPKGETEKSMLEKVTFHGLAERYLDKTEKEAAKLSPAKVRGMLPKEYTERADYELSIMGSMGFDGYFLIVADFISWGKSKGIVFGPGRGSAAGSIVAYGMKITELDPMKYGLLFERFLNPDRISMPDIDIDIQDSRRDEVIQYTVDKYGQDQVAAIVTYGTMAARNAIRDVSRVLEVPYAEADRLAKLVPPPIQGRHIPLSVSIVEDKDLANEYSTNENSKMVIDYATRLEGTIRSHGVHAAGVVIAPDDITNYTPLEMSQKGVVATQYAMGPVEELGLLKMDFLGLSNLTTINNALRIIKRVYGKDIDIDKIPLDDDLTFELLAEGKTTGVFQLESAGMKRYIRKLKPNLFEDIVAMVALYRPGPMQFIDDFIDRKHGKKKISFVHENTKAALESTYGILVYQEQVMQIARQLAGFTGGQADTLRKAIGKKKRDVLAKMKSDFVEGSQKTSGLTKKAAEDIWKDWEAFADYAFNKSHAACYGLISYQTAYLKAHYPDAFMAALMTSDYDDTDRLAIEIKESQSLGIEVAAPDINESYSEFAIVKNKNRIRFGMQAIKNVGRGAVEELISERDKNGNYLDFSDFINRTSATSVNKKTIEALIKSGAFDAFMDRSVLLANMEAQISYYSKMAKQRAAGQTDLFGESTEIEGVRPEIDKSAPRVDIQEQLLWERELMGLYLSDHPLKNFREFLDEHSADFKTLKSYQNDEKITVGGLIQTVNQIITKKGAKMAFATLEDSDGVSMELIVFPRTFDSYQDLIKPNSIVLISGQVKIRSAEEPDPSVAIDELQVLTRMNIKRKPTIQTSKKKASRVKLNKTLYIKIDDLADTDLLDYVKSTINKFPGKDEVVVVVETNGNKTGIRLPQSVEIKPEMIELIKDKVGDKAIHVKN